MRYASFVSMAGRLPRRVNLYSGLHSSAQGSNMPIFSAMASRIYKAAGFEAILQPGWKNIAQNLPLTQDGKCDQSYSDSPFTLLS